MQIAGEFYKVSVAQFGEENYENIRLPERATVGSAGYDIFAPCDFCLKPGEDIIIRTGIRVRINEGWMLMVFPRSGMGYKYQVRLANTVGIIDSDYFEADNEGHIMIKLCGVTSELSVKKGTAFAQAIFVPYGITESDSASGKRTGGFGSTDKKE